MKKLLLLPIFLISLNCFSQAFPGYRSGSYTGVNGVFFNPANIAGGNYKYDINILSFHTMVGNDKASFKLGELGDTFKGDSLKKKLFSAENGSTSGMIDFSVHGPSFMLSLNKKTAIAFTTRARTIANIIDLDGKLAEQLVDDLNASTTLPYTINSTNNQRITANAWTEIGASVARVLMNNGPHFLKAGVTLKYLGGIGNGYINVNALKGTIDNDILGEVYLSNASGGLSTGFGGLDIANLEGGDFFNFKNAGFGADLGVVYEFRPAGSGNYKFKAGLALTDLGSIKYKRDVQKSGSYQLDITGSERFYFAQLTGKDIDEYNDVFKANPDYFTVVPGDNSDYSVALPSSLQFDFDYHLKSNFYAAFSAQLPFGSDKIYNAKYYSNFSLVPRYEGRKIGIYLPLQYHALSNFNAGLSFRLGPIFFGSGSVLSALVGESKQADFHFGARFGGGSSR